MHEVPTTSTFIINEHNPPVTFHASCHSHFNLRFIHIIIGVMIPSSLPYFMSYNSYYLHSNIPYNHAIIIREQHIVTCITYHIRLNNIHNIHSRSHDYVLKHNNPAYNLITRANPRARANIQQITRNLRRVSHLLGRP